MEITIGADPEFFLLYNDEPISVEGKLGGTKRKPKPIDEFGNMYQEDNVAVEFNICPSKTKEEFRQNIKKVLTFLKSKFNTSFSFSDRSALFFPETELKTVQAMTFGCEPDYNAWTNEINPPPNIASLAKTKLLQKQYETLRSAGGHVHIGCELALEKPLEIIQACDLFLGVPSILIDTDNTRRKLYGKAGSFRYKNYGVEYRSLSNFWIWNDYYIDWVFQNTMKAINFVKNHKTIDSHDTYLIQHCINQGDNSLSQYLIQKYDYKPVFE